MAVDIGKEQTSFVIYEDGYPLRYETLPIGGDAVTRDISIGMQIDIKEAEDIKIKDGGLGLIEKEQGETAVDKHFLYQIMTARYEEILEKINTRLIELGKDGRLA
ncbi:MAG: cell division FtsA domain-containing protein [Candidatus Peribacteria bacterium]|nr:MAG: cell division FtsA domain-containing protein [Candidatus Peribacteria bacterium]